MVIVPSTPNDTPRWTQRTSLAGVEYVLTFNWNDRLGLWSLDLADAHADPIASGLALVISWPLLDRAAVRDPRRPPGDFMLIDQLGQNADATYTSLGARHLLAYVDRDELS